MTLKQLNKIIETLTFEEYRVWAKATARIQMCYCCCLRCNHTCPGHTLKFDCYFALLEYREKYLDEKIS